MICKNCGIDTNLLSRVLDKAEREQARIAELEAELASLKDQTKAKWVEAYSRICPDITQEGEG